MVLLIHRMAHKLALLRVPLLPRILYGLNRILFAVVLPPTVKLGRGVLLGYSGLGTVIHARAVIGDRVHIGTNVTIGGRSGYAGVPVVEDDVEIGSGAKILGPIVIGAKAKIGANAVVLKSVPPGAVVIGIPGRIISTPEQ
jgi:serine O-acetyltransferase